MYAYISLYIYLQITCTKRYSRHHVLGTDSRPCLHAPEHRGKWRKMSGSVLHGMRFTEKKLLAGHILNFLDLSFIQRAVK